MVDQPDGIRTFVSGRHLDNDPRRSTILEPNAAEPHHAPSLAFAAGARCRTCQPAANNFSSFVAMFMPVPNELSRNAKQTR